MIEKKDILLFNDWCKNGPKNYKNFPVGRTDKLSPDIVAQFISWHTGISYDEAISYECKLTKEWMIAIRNAWIEGVLDEN